MSVIVLARVWSGCPEGGSELLALLALADWSDDQGRCYPSMCSIAKKTRLSESQARRVVHVLIERGFLSVTGNPYGGAPGSTRQYKINLDKLTASVCARGGADATPSTGARDGSHPCAETPSAHASLTVNGEKSPPFDTFWKAYPAKKARADAQKAWKSAKLDSLLDTILAAIEAQKSCEAWIKGFIPNPATWLRGRRWEDEVETAQLGKEVERDYI